MNRIEGLSWQKVHCLDPDHRVAIVLSAQAARLTHNFPFTSWEESRLAHYAGPAEALSRQLLSILDDFRNFDRKRAWRVLGVRNSLYFKHC
jgi:hypothetical protein